MVDFIETCRRDSDNTADSYETVIDNFAKVYGQAPDQIVSDIKTGKLDYIDFFRKLNVWSGQKKHRPATTGAYFAGWTQFFKVRDVAAVFPMEKAFPR